MLNNRVNNTFRATLLAIAVLVCTCAFAQEPNPDDNQPKTKQSQQSSAPAKPTANSRPSVNTEFEPTEEISEDISVPFPVDI